MMLGGQELRRVDVAAGIIWRGDRFLAAERPSGSSHEGFWEFPGGKIEEGESPGDALAREICEELGITVTESVFWQIIEHAYPERAIHVCLHFFHVRRFEGDPAPMENQRLRWVTTEEALALNFLPADHRILAQLNALRLI